MWLSRPEQFTDMVERSTEVSLPDLRAFLLCVRVQQGNSFHTRLHEWFWACMGKIDHADRALVLRFAEAQSKLPSQDWLSPHCMSRLMLRKPARSRAALSQGL
jgi:hypothetical protein